MRPYLTISVLSHALNQACVNFHGNGFFKQFHREDQPDQVLFSNKNSFNPFQWPGSDPDLVAKSKKRVWFDPRPTGESLAYCLNLFPWNGDWLIAEPYEAMETRRGDNVEPALQTSPNENITGE
jgi:hypothetical protein